MVKKILICILLIAILPINISAGESDTYPVVSSDANEALTRIGAVRLMETILPSYGGGVPYVDCDDPTVMYYRKMGIVSGVKENLFKPYDSIKTEDFLLLLKRTLDIACPDLFYDNRMINWHYDQNEISPYAQSQIAFLSTIGIYNNSGYLKPKSTISIGMASYYLSLASRAQNYGKRSHNGQKGAKIPDIIMYHRFGTPAETENYKYLYVSDYNFEQQIKYLYDNGYAFLFPEELSLADEIQKSVIITIDDGFKEVYEKAYPVLKKYNAKATLFVIADKIGNSGFCTGNELREMSDSGCFRIYSHTCSHENLRNLTTDEMDTQFARANDIIYNYTHREVTSLAYPGGYYDDKVVAEAKKYYKSAFSVINSSGTIYTIPRKTIDDSLNIDDFTLRLKL